MPYQIFLLFILALLPRLGPCGLIDDITSGIDSGLNDLGELIHHVGSDIETGINDVTQHIDNAISGLDNHIHRDVKDIQDKFNEAKDVWSNITTDVHNTAEDIENRIDRGIEGLNQDVKNEIDTFKTSLSNFTFHFRNLFTDIDAIWHNVTHNLTETIQALDLFNFTNISLICDPCQSLIQDIKEHGGYKSAQALVTDIGVVFCEDRYHNSTFCHQAVNLYADFLFNQIIIKNVTSLQICQRLNLCSKPDQSDLIASYVQEVMKDKPSTSYPIPTYRSTYKILQLADPHIDFEYVEGNNAACNTPLCCRAENGVAPNASVAAQYWGTKAVCDIPYRTFAQFCQFASTQIAADMIVWVGDNIAHDFWEESQNNQTFPTINVTKDLLTYFPTTTVYPMFGNHEAFPIDEYDMVGNTTSWLTSELADAWNIWLDMDAETSFRNYSYYATENTKFNFKMIALDSQACDNFDLYLIENPTDPFHQLVWLRNELNESESKNQSVFIMGHIPSGDFFCSSAWAERYRALVDRFTNIIRGQFFGHTHNDQIQIHRSFADNSPVGVNFIAPSMTTYSNLSPSFRVYEIDTDTNVVLNYYQYRLDLDKWNQNTTGPIEWDLAYDAISEYNLTDMSFKSFDDFADRMKTDPAAAQAYASNFETGTYDVSNLTERETENYYCGVKNSVVADIIDCLGLQADVTNVQLFAAQLIPGGWSYARC